MNTNISDYLDSGPDLPMGERAACVIGGLMLAAAGTKPRPNMLLSVLAVAAGSYLAYRGAVGHCAVKAMLSDAKIAADRNSEIAPGAI